MNSKKLLAYCGIDCSECEAYLATINSDMDAKEKMAAEAFEQMGKTVLPDEINCMGCTSNGPHISYCDECEIRACARKKNVDTCNECPEYPCDMLESFLSNNQKARENLESLIK